MAKWRVEFYGSEEVEADTEDEALLAAGDKFDPFSNATADCEEPMCSYCENRVATVTSPYWDDGDVCNYCASRLEEDNAEEEEDEDSE